MLLGVSLFPASAKAAPPKDVPTVTDAAQVTPDMSMLRAHVEPQVARSPKTGALVIAEADVRGSRDCIVHISFDDGRSWAEGGKPLEAPLSDCTFHADYGPYYALAYDHNGILDMAIEASDRADFDKIRNDAPRSIFFSRSTDDGRTFSTVSVFRAPAGNPDKSNNKGATMAIDPNDPNRIYVGWRQGAFGATATEKLKTMVASSADAGKTWGAPVDVSDQRGGDYPRIAVTGDGVVHVSYWTRVWPTLTTGQPAPVLPIYHVSSTDHGRTFSPLVLVDPGNQRAEFPPMLAADPKTGALYVAWSGNADAMNRAPDFKGDLEIFFRRSTDGGKTWSDRKVLNDDTPGKANQFTPGLAVAPNGRIDVAWYDGRLSPVPVTSNTETGFNDVFASSSSDGGQSFTANVRVSDRSADRSIGVWSNNVDQRINVGLSSSNGAMYVAWQDSRNANRDFQPEDVYAASVKFDDAYITPVSHSRSVPGWLTFVAGLALGLGVAIAVAAGLTRRSRSSN